MSVLKCCVFQGKVTNELSQVLEEEEKKWLDTLNIEEYQIPLARTVIQVSTGHMDHLCSFIYNKVLCLTYEVRACDITCCLNSFS